MGNGTPSSEPERGDSIYKLTFVFVQRAGQRIRIRKALRQSARTATCCFAAVAAAMDGDSACEQASPAGRSRPTAKMLIWEIAAKLIWWHFIT